MSKRATKHLKKYNADCAEQHIYVSLTRYSTDPESVDAQIDLLGSMHQSLWLSNQTDGYLREFAGTPDDRIQRSFQRLLQSPYDDRALRVLSYHNIAELSPHIAEWFPHKIFAQLDAPVYSIGFCTSRSGGAFKEYIELQCDTSGAITRIHFARALLNRAPDSVNNQYYSGPDAGLVFGPCITSRYMTAAQPYGFWYEYEGERNFPDEAAVRAATDNVDKWYAKKSRLRSSET